MLPQASIITPCATSSGHVFVDVNVTQTCSTALDDPRVRKIAPCVPMRADVTSFLIQSA